MESDGNTEFEPLDEVKVAQTEDSREEIKPDDVYQKIQEYKEIIATVRSKPWPMHEKIRVLSEAKKFVEKYEGTLSKTKGYSEAGKEVWRKFKRFHKDVCAVLTPWDKRIKTVESYFGSSVASYFTFLRWLVYINVVIAAVSMAFVVVPELLVGNKDADYKKINSSKIHKAWDLETIWALGGYLEHSVLFYGFYTNDRVVGNGYRIPLAYFLVGIATFAYSFIAVLRKMAKNSRQSGNVSSADDYTFSWKIFSSWDYMIGNTETAENKSAAIATALRETIVEEQEKEKDMNNRKALRIVIRVGANVVVLMLLAGSLYSILFAVSRAQSQTVNEETTFWEQNEVGIVITLVTMITPSLFEVIGSFEQYHPRNTLRIQLGRILMLYLGNLYSLMIGLLQYVPAASDSTDEQTTYTQHQEPQIDVKNPVGSLKSLSNTRPKRMIYNVTLNMSYLLGIIDAKESLYDSQMKSSSTTLTTKKMPTVSLTTMPSLSTFTTNASYPSTKYISTMMNNSVISTKPESECWETFVGQELVKLTIIDLISTILTVLLIDYIRALIVRYCNICCCWDLEKKFPEYGEFKIAENVLHLIYNQGVTWIGSFFCPLLSVVNVLKLTILMYLRSWALVTCNVPHSRVFRASGSNFYLAMLLFMLFLSLLPTVWVIMQCPPSNCGPFKNKKRIHTVLSETLETDTPEWIRSIIKHLATPVVVLPSVLLLFMVIYYMQSVSRSVNANNTRLKLQLQYERTEGRKNIFNFGAGRRMETATSTPHSIKDTISSPIKTTNSQQDQTIVRARSPLHSLRSMSVESSSCDGRRKENLTPRRHVAETTIKNNTLRNKRSKCMNEEHIHECCRPHENVHTVRAQLHECLCTPEHSVKNHKCGQEQYSTLRGYGGSCRDVFSECRGTNSSFSANSEQSDGPTPYYMQQNLHATQHVPLILLPHPVPSMQNIAYLQPTEKVLFVHCDQTGKTTSSGTDTAYNHL